MASKGKSIEEQADSSSCTGNAPQYVTDTHVLFMEASENLDVKIF